MSSRPGSCCGSRRIQTGSGGASSKLEAVANPFSRLETNPAAGNRREDAIANTCLEPEDGDREPRPARVLLTAVTRYVLLDESVIRFRSGNLRLEGTLPVPPLASDAPGVVLVHGSGPTTRRAMRPCAWVVAFAGYAALVYDRRSLGASDGPADDWNYFSIDELAGDAAAALRLLRIHPAVDASRTGYFATRQGAWAAALAANQEPPPAFMVMVSASISTIREDRLFGMQAQLRHQGSISGQCIGALNCCAPINP